jgi:hypothetical protein
MNKEHYNIWKSKQEFPNLFSFISISDNGRQLLRIKIEEIGNNVDLRTLQIEFTNPIFYRVCEEGLRLRSIHEVKTYRGLSVSSNSELLKWIHEESYGIVEDTGLLHYVIYCEDIIVDVLSNDEGVITMI